MAKQVIGANNAPAAIVSKGLWRAIAISVVQGRFLRYLAVDATAVLESQHQNQSVRSLDALFG